jgi:hypothetical protein
MKIPVLARRALGVIGAAALLSACARNGAQSSAFVPNAGITANGSPLVRGATSLDTARSGDHVSWIDPDAKRGTLLYVPTNGFLGGGLYGVYVFTWPRLKLAGTMTTNYAMGGACSDTKGNVYIVISGYSSTQAAQVREYSHQGDLLNTYIDNEGSPGSCAVNPKNGDLAVANVVGPLTGYFYEPGNLLIYSSSSSAPTVLTNSSEDNYDSVGYDQHGHLWEDGSTKGGSFLLSSCTKESCTTIPVSGATINFPGSLLWDQTGRTWLVFDIACNRPSSNSGLCSYTISGTGFIGSKTTYNNYEGGATCDSGQDVLTPDHKYIVGGDAAINCGYTAPTVENWAYPAGGQPTKDYIFEGTPDASPSGAAFSIKS